MILSSLSIHEVDCCSDDDDLLTLQMFTVVLVLSVPALHHWIVVLMTC